jgi:predicted nucleotidyltransferase
VPFDPTPYPDVNLIVKELLASVQEVLKNHLVGMYLEGSLAHGGFDPDSDIDFVVVTDESVSEDCFLALQAMHDRIARLDSGWSIQLEGSYVSRHALSRHDPAQIRHPNIERGSGERLKMADHEEAWNIHRYILREHGIPLMGPPPKTLVDPVSTEDLRQSMLSLLSSWATHLLQYPQEMNQRGYQSYVVLSLCRILYTLEFGKVVSKPLAVGWAKENLDGMWRGLIDRAWAGRHNPGLPAEAEDIRQTQDLIRFTIAYSQQDRREGYAS